VVRFGCVGDDPLKAERNQRNPNAKAKTIANVSTAIFNCSHFRGFILTVDRTPNRFDHDCPMFLWMRKRPLLAG